MSDKCHLCLLGLIFLSSLLTGTSGVDDAHVFISSGENVSLPCKNDLPDWKSTTWIYNNRHPSTVELIGLGIKKKDTGRDERLSLGPDCSLNIKNITKEDYGSYICQQFVNGKQQGTDARVYLHVLHVSSSSSQTEISAGSSVTLSCQLYSYAGVSCDDLIRSEGTQLFWVNQAGVKLMISDSRYQILFSSEHCISTLTTTLLNEDDNREWRCNVTHRDQVKTSATYTVKISAQDKTTTAVNPVHITNSQDPSTTKSPETKTQTDSATAVIPVHITNSQDPSTTKSPETKTQADSTTAVTVLITNSQNSSTTKSPETSKDQVTVISVSAAASTVFLLAVLCLIWRKRACNKRGTGGSSVKDENEDKGAYETINMSIPAAARDHELTDDVTYSEVTSSSKKPVKSLTDHNDAVTYAAIR